MDASELTCGLHRISSHGGSGRMGLGRSELLLQMPGEYASCYHKIQLYMAHSCTSHSLWFSHLHVNGGSSQGPLKPTHWPAHGKLQQSVPLDWDLRRTATLMVGLTLAGSTIRQPQTPWFSMTPETQRQGQRKQYHRNAKERRCNSLNVMVPIR